ncbi:MAG TPA: MASE4 domain-containing protein [Burkholderiales bacterium]|nr:MASE4 domain-containing protein [Burkholderiales bacterium]
MAQEPQGKQSLFLSTVPAGPKDRRLALGVLIVSFLIFLGLAPFAKTPLGQVWAFIPTYQSALIINDLVTAALLYGQFAILRSRGLLILASAYVFSALMAVAHALSFPGLFAQSGLLGAGSQTTAWLYFLWHGGFPLIVIAYALLKEPARPSRVGIGILAGAGGATLAAVALTVLTTVGHDALPVIMTGNRDASTKIIVATVSWLLCLAALPFLWRRRPHTVLDLWLMVVMCTWLFDIALASVLNAGRFDLGFYSGRVYGLLAASFVLLVLLLENIKLYADLATVNESEQQKTRELTILNKELEAFSYSVSHDLRAPLRAMNGYAEMLIADYAAKLDDDGRRMLERMRVNSERMGQLIDDLLAFSRLGRQPIKTQQVELDDLVGQTIEELRADVVGNRRIDFSIARLGTAKADPALLKQALTNLLSNAVKFTRDKPEPVIEVGCRIEQNAQKVYYVKDNGAGFDMRFVHKLFGVFQRLHSNDEFEGTGIGLAIVQRVINRHGGRVWADSTLGQGTAFYFTLEPGGG